MSERIVVERQSKEGKTRSFEARVVGMTISNMAPWVKPNDDKLIQPVSVLIVGDDSSVRAVVANLRTGRRCWLTDRKRNTVRNKQPYPSLDLTGTKYQYLFQQFDEGTICHVYSIDLYNQDPGMIDPDDIQFIAPVPKQWVEEQQQYLQAIDPELKSWAIKEFTKVCKPQSLKSEHEWQSIADSIVECAAMTCVYLDRRTRIPILPDLRFQVRLFLECVTVGLCRYPEQKNERYSRQWGFSGPSFISNDREMGLVWSIQCRASHDSFQSVLARVVNQHFAA